jgi:hypothetical protein
VGVRLKPALFLFTVKYLTVKSDAIRMWRFWERSQHQRPPAGGHPTRSLRHPEIRCQTQTLAAPGAAPGARSRCHSAHQRPPRGSSEPARVSDMLGQTDRRRQSAGGPADSARMPPRGAGTTASAAPPSRSDQDATAPDSGGAGPGLCPEWQRARCARIFRMTAGSCSVAIRRRRPPQWAHGSTSMPKDDTSYCTSCP